MAGAVTQREASKAPEQRMRVTLSKALFFFEKGGVADGPGQDAKWPEWRDRYMKRGAKLGKILEKQGVTIAARELELAE